MKLLTTVTINPLVSNEFTDDMNAKKISYEICDLFLEKVKKMVVQNYNLSLEMLDSVVINDRFADVSSSALRIAITPDYFDLMGNSANPSEYHNMVLEVWAEKDYGPELNVYCAFVAILQETEHEFSDGWRSSPYKLN
ncbi:hypothetical protein JCM30760_26940 [Thiomicrorhabdus hydrogeniphila]